MAAPHGDGRNRQQPNDASFAIGTEGTNAITVGIQLLNGNREIAGKAVVDVYLSSDAAGDVPVAAQTSLALGTDGSLLGTLIAATTLRVLSEADGDIDVVITDTGVYARYLNVVLPNGSKVTSGAITFA